MFRDPNMRKYLGGWALFGVVMLLTPFFVSSGTLRIMIFANYLAIFAMSWDILSGRTGYISFGHPFLIGVAGYTTAMLTYHLDTPLVISIPLAVLATMIGGTLFFVPANLSVAAGLTVHHAYLVYDANGRALLASNAVPLVLK